MAKICTIITGDKQKIAVDSYSHDRKGCGVVLRIYNPASSDEVIDMMEKCNFSSFDLIAEYPGGRRKDSHFVLYELAGCTVTHKSAGTVLEIYLKKLEVV